MNKTLKECLQLIIDKRGVTPKKLKSDWCENGYRVLSANNVKTSGIEKLDEIRCIDEETYRKWMKDEIKRGDILLTSEAPAGEVYYWDSDERIVSGQRLYVLRTVPEVNPIFLKYYIQSSKGQSEIRNKCSGSTVFGISAKTFDSIEIVLPDEKDIQDKIGRTLKVLDDKVENNNKINEELESMAKAIYDYWFLQFEFSNEKGKPYKSSGGKMVWNEELKKEIPEGWAVKTLKDISEIKAGGDKPKIFSKFITKECNIPIYSNGLENNGLYGYTEQATIEEGSVTVSARGTIGYANLRNTAFMPIVRLICVTPKNKKYAKYIEIFMNKHEFNKNGSIQQQLTIPQISPMKIICPDEKTMDKFNDIMSSIIKKEIIIEKENKELISLRDCLIPLLMNGQVGFRELALAED